MVALRMAAAAAFRFSVR